MTRRNWSEEELQESFRINEEGELERKFKKKGWAIIVCRSNCRSGYCYVQFNDSKIMYHTIVWILTNGTIEDEFSQIKHKNGNRLDNRIENLRLVAKRADSQSEVAHRDRYLVECYFHRSSNKWRAQIQINKKLINLGCYNAEQEARQAYQTALTMLDKTVKEIKELVHVTRDS